MILIKNGFIIENNQLIKKDILIEDNYIKQIDESIALDCEILDATGCLVMPGAVDVHVHLREPGFTKKETVKTGTMSSAKGGVTRKDWTKNDTGAKFYYGDTAATVDTTEEIKAADDELRGLINGVNDDFMDVVDANMSAESIQEMLSNVFAGASQTAKGNLKTLGYADLNDPETITFYPKDFETKEGVIQILNDYNETMKEEDEEKVVKYTDMVGSLMTSVTDIIDIIGYVLIAFVSVSLI